MNAQDQGHYRQRLAEGFLDGAQQDLRSQRWRSCVSNALTLATQIVERGVSS